MVIFIGKFEIRTLSDFGSVLSNSWSEVKLSGGKTKGGI